MRIHMIDSSGGITAEDLNLALANVKVGDTVACFDTAIHGEKVMTTQADIDGYRFHGGGGTLLTPVLNHVAEKANWNSATLVLIYSDMYFYEDMAAVLKRTSFNGLMEIVFVNLSDRDISNLNSIHNVTVRGIKDQPILYLAEINQRVTEYMGDSEQGFEFTRLVRARSEAEAEYLIQSEFTSGDQYGVMKRVYSVALHPVLE